MTATRTNRKERQGLRPSLRGALLLATLLLVSAYGGRTEARDAAFLDPQTAAGAGAGEDAIKVEPKSEIDIGDSVLGVARRLDLFFVNQSGVAVKVNKMTVNGDGNVATEIASDDCSKEVSIPPGSRCSVEVSVTPSSPGAWSAEVLMTHDGIGRIARAKLTGKTAGQLSGEKKDMGLALNTKESNPVNFGEVDVGAGKTVRSALMVNDSAEPITLYSIDVIEASNGLTRLEQGCAVDMELKPGESCPVTLVWKPSGPGQISTDLIIRHSGRLGFAVIPVRGSTKMSVAGAGGYTSESSQAHASGERGKTEAIPPPPGANEVANAAGGKIPSVAAETLNVSNSATSASKAASNTLYLIGTVGNRAVILKPDGKTDIANAGDEVEFGDRTGKVIMVNAKSVELLIDGKKKTLTLTSSPDLIASAAKSGKKENKASASADSMGPMGGPGAAGALPSSGAQPPGIGR